MAVSKIPSLNWIRVFEAAARTDSFAKAGEILNMSPSAVSQQIKALEGYLERPLFTRGPKSVALTEAGATFLPVVVQSLNAVETAAAGLFGDRDHQTLTVLSTLLLANGWLARRLPRFRAAHPEIQLTLLTAIYQEDTVRVADLTISFGVPPRKSEESDTLFGERLYPVAPPEIARQIRSAHDLARWPLIEVATHRANWFAHLPDPAPEARFIYTDNSTTAYALAASEGAIALARDPASEGLPERHGLVPCLTGAEMDGVQFYSLIYPAQSALSAAARSFRTWLQQEVEASLR